MGASYYYAEPGGETQGPLPYGTIKMAVSAGKLTRDVMLTPENPETPETVWLRFPDVRGRGDHEFLNEAQRMRAVRRREQNEQSRASGQADGGGVEPSSSESISTADVATFLGWAVIILTAVGGFITGATVHWAAGLSVAVGGFLQGFVLIILGETLGTLLKVEAKVRKG